MDPTRFMWIELDSCDGLGSIELDFFNLPVIMSWVEKTYNLTQPMHTTIFWWLW